MHFLMWVVLALVVIAAWAWIFRRYTKVPPAEPPVEPVAPEPIAPAPTTAHKHHPTAHTPTHPTKHKPR